MDLDVECPRLQKEEYFGLFYAHPFLLPRPQGMGVVSPI